MGCPLQPPFPYPLLDPPPLFANDKAPLCARRGPHGSEGPRGPAALRNNQRHNLHVKAVRTPPPFTPSPRSLSSPHHANAVHQKTSELRGMGTAKCPLSPDAPPCRSLSMRRVRTSQLIRCPHPPPPPPPPPHPSFLALSLQADGDMRLAAREGAQGRGGNPPREGKHARDRPGGHGLERALRPHPQPCQPSALHWRELLGLRGARGRRDLPRVHRRRRGRVDPNPRGLLRRLWAGEEEPALNVVPPLPS